jgi:hypothetical protein
MQQMSSRSPSVVLMYAGKIAGVLARPKGII